MRPNNLRQFSFSQTVESCFVDWSRIRFEDDVRSDHAAVLTDGCGLIAPGLFRRCLEEAGLESSTDVCAFQGRFGPAKGLFLRMPGLPEGVDLVLRKSQVKYELHQPWKPDFRRMEVCLRRRTVDRAGSHLSTQAVALLHFLGVSADVLVKMQSEMIRALFVQIFESSDVELSKFLWVS